MYVKKGETEPLKAAHPSPVLMVLNIEQEVYETWEYFDNFTLRYFLNWPILFSKRQIFSLD